MSIKSGNFSCYIISLAICIAAGSTASAEEITAIVAAGKRSPIGTFGTYNTFTCTHSGESKATVAIRPQNGVIDVVGQFHTINAGRCGKINAFVNVVYFTPNKGFRGTDVGAVDFEYFRFAEAQYTTSQRATYKITVK
jgi:hypothetical protein